MKKQIPGFIAGVLVTVLLMTTVIPAVAANLEVYLNTVNITMNGQSIAKKGDNFVTADGKTQPFSLNYDGTTYLPMRKLAEVLGLDIEWDGSTGTATLKSTGVVSENGDGAVGFSYEEFKALWSVEELLSRPATKDAPNYRATYTRGLGYTEFVNYLYTTNTTTLRQYFLTLATEIMSLTSGDDIYVSFIYADSQGQPNGSISNVLIKDNNVIGSIWLP